LFLENIYLALWQLLVQVVNYLRELQRLRQPLITMTSSHY